MKRLPLHLIDGFTFIVVAPFALLMFVGLFVTYSIFITYEKIHWRTEGWIDR